MGIEMECFKINNALNWLKIFVSTFMPFVHSVEKLDTIPNTIELVYFTSYLFFSKMFYLFVESESIKYFRINLVFNLFCKKKKEAKMNFNVYKFKLFEVKFINFEETVLLP